MKKTNHTHILARYLLISLLIFILAGLIVFKLFKTTVIDADKWNKKANSELLVSKVIHPQRGDILAADGSVLATNLTFYTLRMDFRAERFKSHPQVMVDYKNAIPVIADSLCRFFPNYGKTRAQWIKHLSAPLDLEFKKRPRGFRIIDNLSFADLERVRTIPFFDAKYPAKHGLVIDSKVRRTHPYGNMALRSIGRVGQTRECAEIHGISGLECALDSLLYGVPGVSKKIPLTRRIADWTDTAAVPGYTIKSTIDIGIQDIVENELNTVLETCDADWGVAVLMDVSTGDIKAISNLEKSPRSGKYIEAINRAVQGFEPGSVMKPISMLIALENGLVSDPNRVISTGFSYAYAGGRPITDSHGCTSMRVSEVIERSSNIGMTKVITGDNSIYHRDPSQFYKSLEASSFFKPLNTGIAGERTPVIEKNPSRISLSRMCYGYATMIPPIYTLAIYNAIANDGVFVRPRLYSELLREDSVPTVIPVSVVDTICTPRNAAILRDMLRSVVEGEHGTGKRLRNPLVNIAGKTGTCYMVDPKTHQYNTGRKRLAFCGFFPAEKPKYSCIVLTCHPKQNMFGAASTSGQVMKNIAMKMFSRGLLDNVSDFRADTQAPKGASPKFYHTSTTDTYRHSATITGYQCRSAAKQATSEGIVPDVSGLGLREAVVAIERAGYNVAFEGRGCVNSQRPQAGQQLRRGSTVIIRLI